MKVSRLQSVHCSESSASESALSLVDLVITALVIVIRIIIVVVIVVAKDAYLKAALHPADARCHASKKARGRARAVVHIAEGSANPTCDQDADPEQQSRGKD